MIKPPIRSALAFPDLLREMKLVIAQARRNDKDVSANTRVYFIQENGMGAIKIGVSKHAQPRVREMQGSTPHTLALLATVEGGHGVEHALHSLFAHAHIRGEWFRPIEELIEYIKNEGELPEATAKREEEELFEKRRNTRVIA